MRTVELGARIPLHQEGDYIRVDDHRAHRDPSSAGFCCLQWRSVTRKSSTDSSSGQPPSSTARSLTGSTPCPSARTPISEPCQKSADTAVAGSSSSSSGSTSATTRSRSRGGSRRKSRGTVSVSVVTGSVFNTHLPTAGPRPQSGNSIARWQAVRQTVKRRLSPLPLPDRGRRSPAAAQRGAEARCGL